MTEKKKIFYSVSEVAEMVSVTSQTIRNWEKGIPQLKVHTDDNGRRFFTVKNLEVLKKIKKWRDDGYSYDAIRKLYSKKVDKNIENIIIRLNSLIDRINDMI
ncbi:MerR family transcriptional regulator [Candidatus Calescamantes bacterium]|nr:MerR family transcriptional regulator [Candidatus Calescamantes bacterium]MCK5398551.1 MerR family transcriptional regulator [bacterium]MCK5598745.1 MerR family transcriptional regulator [bacterium]